MNNTVTYKFRLWMIFSVAPLTAIIFSFYVASINSVIDKLIELKVDRNEFSYISLRLIFLLSCILLFISGIIILISIFFGLTLLKDKIYEDAVQRVQQDIKNSGAIAVQVEEEIMVA